MKNKKTLVLVALAVVLVGVGAFGFLKPEPKYEPKVIARSGEPEATGTAAAPKQKAPEKGKDERAEQLMALVTGPLTARDPFEPLGSMAMEGVTPAKATGTSSVPPPPVARPARRTSSVPPLEPLAGSFGSAAPGMGLAPSSPLRQPSEFGYRVKGVVVGAKPVAVLEDEGGNQRLVPLGGSVDGDSRVVGIEKGRIRIRHRGKVQTLTLSEGQ
jgi:hypothetical protein